MSSPIFIAEGLSKRFGGLAAVEDVSLALARGSLHAIIGPNGAGKTTLINLLSGGIQPDAGKIRFKGREIAGLSLDRVSRLGIARSFQRRNVFFNFTVFENCRLAAQSRLSTSMRFFLPAHSYRSLNATAEQALDLVGMSGVDRMAATLSHGEVRQLEIAMTLATAPDVLLLDEPLAGMGAEESVQMVELIGKLARDHAVLLVEHDMDAVFSLAEVLTVMVYGLVIASGPPAKVKLNKEVQQAYLVAEDA